MWTHYKKLKDEEKDTVGAKYLKVVNSVSFSDVSVYTVELPVSESGRPEVKKAKTAEINNLLDYDVFEEVKDTGQYTIGSRWVITSKEKHDVQNKQTKARLVTRGFQEEIKPQSDSPTASKESIEIMIAIAANSKFSLASMDIRAAVLQSRVLDRDVFIRTPEDNKKPGMVWR